jgi:CRP/FNR family transcriptional regulator
MQPHLSDLRQLVEHMAAHSRGVKRMEFLTGNVIHEPTDPADLFYAIDSGEIWLFHIAVDGHPRLLEILGAGDWLGSAPLGRLPFYDKRAVATAPTIAWALPIEEFRFELSRHGEVALKIIEDMSKRLHQAWAEGSQLVSEDCRHRLIKTLLRFSTSPAAHPDKDGVILRITHAQLAQAVGAARETVSICLTELRHRKIIRTGRNQLKFNPEELRRLDPAIRN